jgi:hypothetical protein
MNETVKGICVNGELEGYAVRANDSYGWSLYNTGKEDEEFDPLRGRMKADRRLKSFEKITADLTRRRIERLGYNRDDSRLRAVEDAIYALRDEAGADWVQKICNVPWSKDWSEGIGKAIDRLANHYTKTPETTEEAGPVELQKRLTAMENNIDRAFQYIRSNTNQITTILDRDYDK